ncbi:TRAP transporter small permease [Granulosicoccus antarcticus]|uniref:TRAP transporter small permease protein n=1 Tax=Granulosicoccus antarcticus IMCC3135 TaxID=1192854 RepID=A0A2Z2NZE9_9GAMM|nr:TRAP transporter small permease [Granulosicoccus antarcticus]ASJ76822.1 Ectoine/5-hydroxyectoine TRAP transporter small permease protein UehB [Granulosicoccus antarcticus IMCC3135]
MSNVLRYGMGGLASFMVLLMMVVTCIDVVGRYLFNNPLTGAFEITELALAAMIFIGLPLATDTDEHIRVDLLDAFMPDGFRRFLTLVMDWLSALVLAVLAWQLWHKTQSIAADGHVTNTLEIPLTPIGYLMTASCAISALVLVLKGLEAMKRS